MGIENLKQILYPVPGKLKNLRSHDTNDHWLVQETGFDESEYAGATHVLIGCPQDEGVKRNNGRTGAAEAPEKIREKLYRMQVRKNSEVKLYDAGNVSITDFIDDTDSDLKFDIVKESHQKLTKAVSHFLKDGKKVIVLGGGNDISYADVRALSEVEREISAVNIDAHLDMRIADKITSGTPYRNLIEDGFLIPQNFHEFGIRPETNADFYLDEAEKMGVHIHYFQDILKNGVTDSFVKVLSEIDLNPFFLGLDMDSIQASDAPGVSASSPVGFSGREVQQFLHHARKKENLKLFEITEVNPKYDIGNMTTKWAATFVYEFLFGDIDI